MSFSDFFATTILLEIDNGQKQSMQKAAHSVEGCYYSDDSMSENSVKAEKMILSNNIYEKKIDKSKTYVIFGYWI